MKFIFILLLSSVIFSCDNIQNKGKGETPQTKPKSEAQSIVDKAREAGIEVPIIPGIKPIAVKRHLQLLPQVFRLDIPDELVNAVEQCKNNAEVREVGIAFAVQLSKEFMEYCVPVLHYYSMGKSDNIKKIAKEVF